MEAMNAMITEIRIMMGRMEEKIDNMNNSMSEAKSTAFEAQKLASEALQSTKSAHLRLDKYDKILFWVTTTIVGAVILSLLATLWNISR